MFAPYGATRAPLHTRFSSCTGTPVPGHLPPLKPWLGWLLLLLPLRLLLPSTHTALGSEESGAEPPAAPAAWRLLLLPTTVWTQASSGRPSGVNSPCEMEDSDPRERCKLLLLLLLLLSASLKGRGSSSRGPTAPPATPEARSGPAACSLSPSPFMPPGSVVRVRASAGREGVERVARQIRSGGAGSDGAPPLLHHAAYNRGTQADIQRHTHTQRHTS